MSGNVLSARSVNRALFRIVRDYNDIEIKKAKEENRRPKLLPHITNHTLRYTFCTRLVEMNIPVKVVQTLMGHASFETTMNIYATIEQEYNKQVIKKFDTQMYLGQI